MDRPPRPELIRLGDVIRRTRRKAKLTQVQLAKALSVVPSTISAWECGTRRVHEQSARDIDRELGSSGVVHRAWKQANDSTAVQANDSTAVPEWYEEVEQLERKISELREYQNQVIPGLVQTEDYARAANWDTSPG